MSQIKYHILVVDDELSMREFLEFMLTREGYDVTLASTGQDAMVCLQKESFDLILCDIRLGDLTGIDVLKVAKENNPLVTVIMISAYATTEVAVEAMNEGAYDYVPKPFDIDELKQTISNALQLKTIEQEKLVLDDELKKTFHFGRIVGNTPKMIQIYDMIRQVACTKTNVMITGESGTGKEMIARSIHEESDRRDHAFVAIHCGGIPESLMESELFGHKKGSFTGATADKKGLFEVAEKGTVFLDEIGELSIPIQVKLLRAVQERAFKTVGGTTDILVDIRIISATNKNLDEEVISGRFREDLFYRLNVIEIKVPALRERKEDIRLLAQHFLEKYSREMGKEIKKISSYAFDMLNKYNFPGNIRELENIIERSVALSTTNILLPDSLAISLHKRNKEQPKPNGFMDLGSIETGVNLDEILEDIEKRYVQKALEITDGNRHKAAELLGISLRSIRYRVKKTGINV